jgi:CyaY protein
MTESEFLQLAESTLRAIENGVDASEAEIEVTRAGNVLTLELEDGSRIVVNSQAPMQQMWVAARSGAHHFAWIDDDWRDTRDGVELFACLSRIISSQSGTPTVLSARGSS